MSSAAWNRVDLDEIEALCASKPLIEIDYTNWRGERGQRVIRPQRLWFGATDWHPGAQWLIDAVDVAKNADRSFAVSDLHGWRTAQS